MREFVTHTSVEMDYQLKVITLEPTPFCNQSCQTCNTWLLTRNREFISSHRGQEQYSLRNVIDQASEMGVEHINLAGAEPFAHKDTIELIESIKAHGMECSLVSNGTLIDEQTAKRLIDSRIDAIRFSVDGASPDIHDQVRGYKGSFVRVITAIDTMNTYGDSQGYIPKLSFNTTISKLNFHEIPKMIELARNHRIKKINFGLVIQTNSEDLITTNQILGSGTTSEQFLKQDDGLMFTNDEIHDLQILFGQAEIVASEFGVEHNISLMRDYLKHPEAIISGRYLSPFMEEGELNCVYPFKRTLVDTYGNVYPCSPIRRIIGNLKDSSLDEIWKGDSYEQFRASFKAHGHFPICLSCCNLNRGKGQKI